MLERSERNLERLRKKDADNEELMNSMKSRLDELELLRQEVAINEARREQLISEVRDGFMVENDTMKRKYDEQIRRLNINHDLIVKDRYSEISSLKEELTNQQLISDKNKRELEVLRREKEQYLPVFIAENKKVSSLQIKTFRIRNWRIVRISRSNYGRPFLRKNERSMSGNLTR